MLPPVYWIYPTVTLLHVLNPPSIQIPTVSLHVRPSNSFNQNCRYFSSGRKETGTVGGIYDRHNKIDQDRWLWMATLLRNGTDQNCSGSLISRQHVLTTAYCVERMKPADLTIRFSASSPSYANALPKIIKAVDVKAGRIIIHPGYNRLTYKNDIAIIRLKHRLEFNKDIQAICLPSTVLSTERPFLTEWGLTVFKQHQSLIYYQLLVPLWSQQQCRAFNSNRPILDAQLCTGLRNPCPSGSGDPLLVERNGHWQLIGLAIYNPKCNVNPTRLYTRITSHLSWIKTVMYHHPEPVEPPVQTTTAKPIFNPTPSPVHNHSTPTTLKPSDQTLTTESVHTSVSSFETTTSIPTTTKSTLPATISTATTIIPSPELEIGCGINYNIETRIVGGVGAMIGQWPWMAILFRIVPQGVYQYCAGVLISDQHILTAAHCLRKSLPEDLYVRLGEHDVFQPTNFTRDFYVQEVFMHEHFNRKNFDNDIGLIRLKKKVDFTNHIRPICLSPINLDLVERGTYVTGWGQTSANGTFNNILQQAIVPVWNQSKCRDAYSKFGIHITENQLCAGYDNGGTDACQGDSGGPLMLLQENGRWAVVGIVSWGVGCADPGVPGIYTRASSYVDWITERITLNQTT